MRARRTLSRTAALAVLALAVGGAALAWACTPNAKLSTVGGAQADAGGGVTIHGTGFVPGAPVQLHWNSAAGEVVGSATASSIGEFQTGARIPSGAADRVYYIVATAPGADGQPATAVQVGGVRATGPGAVRGGDSDSATSDGSGSGATSGTSGRANATPGSTSGTTTGGSVTGQGRNSGTVGGGDRSGAASGAAGNDGVTRLASGQAVFADSVGAGDRAGAAGRRGSASKSAPSQRSASGDLWSGFASGKAGAGGLDDASGPVSGPGSALTLSMALAGLGLVALMGGLGVAERRRRRSLARAGAGRTDSD